MKWLPYFLLLVAALTLARIYFNIRKLREAHPQDDWDARLIERLRLAGSDPFQPHDVDFFIALPSENATRIVAARLESEGYRVDVRSVADNPEHPFSLHANKSLRLSVPDMRQISRRLGALAGEHGGRYDGWAAGHVARES
ncbi:MAG TPA: ribonuclease E inhibitor RraB [Steroidobacteraceae bacterium]